MANVIIGPLNFVCEYNNRKGEFVLFQKQIIQLDCIATLIITYSYSHSIPVVFLQSVKIDGGNIDP